MADISQIALPDSSSSNIKALKLSYGECSTAATTTAKVVTIISNGAASGSNAPFVLEKGAIVLVKFTTTNTGAVANLTLNVNGTGAKSIKYRGTNLPSAGTLAANRVYQFLYDGANWQLVGDINTDTNTAVTQTISSTSNADYRVLFSATADDTTRTETTRKDTNFKYNPSTNNLTVGKVTLGAAPVNDLEASTKKYVDDSINGLPSPMVFRGSLGTGGTITTLPTDGTAAVGDTYKVIAAGRYADQPADVGDMFICDSKSSSANTWAYIPSADDTNIISSAYCDTAGDVDYKFAQCTDYALLSNSYVQLILKNSNTSASKLYLAIEKNGLLNYQPIYINGSVSSSSNYTLPAGTYLVYYDGTNYYFRTDGKITTTGVVDTSNTELYTNNTGTVTGTGTSTKLAKWNGTNSITSGPGITDNSSSTAVTSTDTNLITGRTLYYAGYTKNTGTVTGSSLTSNNIITGNSGTAIKSSGKTIATSITNVDTTVPTSKAVKTYVDELVGNKYVLCSTAASTGTKVIDSVEGYTSYQDIPEGTTIHVLFENANTSSSNTLLKFSADSSGVAILPNKLQWPAKTLLSLTKMPDTSGSSTSYWQSTASYTYSTERVNIADYSSQAHYYPIPICSNNTGDVRLGGNGQFSYNPSARELRVGSIAPESDLTHMSISGGFNGTMSISGEKALNITGGTSNDSTGIKMTDASPNGIVIKSTNTTSGSGVKIAGKQGVYLAGALSSDGDPAYGVTVTAGNVSGYGTVPTLTATNLRLQGTNALMLQGTNWPTGTANAAHINSAGYIIKNTSSRRYKNSIDYNLNYEDYHNQLMQFKPCTFKYNDQPDELQLGLIAEDVEEINPNIVVHEQNGAPDGLKDRDLITLLIIESQKKDKEIAALKEDIEDLKQRLAAIENIIN